MEDTRHFKCGYSAQGLNSVFLNNKSTILYLLLQKHGYHQSTQYFRDIGSSDPGIWVISDKSLYLLESCEQLPF